MSEAPDVRPAARQDVVVVGASAGGVETLQRLVAALPADLDAALLVVLHVPPTGSFLPEILSRAGPLPAEHAHEGGSIEPGRIYVAPPDFHLLVDGGRVRLARGPKEHGHRPAIDPLFRTAAVCFGPRVAGVVLSGAQNDGTAGLRAIGHAGGLTIVQDPDEALYPEMPQSAVLHVQPEHVLPVAGIAALLRGENGGSPAANQAESDGTMQEHESDPTELAPTESTALNEPPGELTHFTCPECSGTLWEIREGGVVKLRCRVGHSYTEETMLSEQATALEAALWSAVRALEEKADFSRRMAARFERTGHARSAGRYEQQAVNALEQLRLVRQAVLALDPPAPAESGVVS